MKRLETMSDWLSVGTDIKIDELKSYLDTLKKQLEHITEEYDKKVEAEAQQIENEQEKDEFYEWSSEEYWNYKETFPRILLTSFHVTAYTLLESEIYSLARRVGKKKNRDFDASKKRDKNYLQHASAFINELTGVNSNKFTSWNKLDDGRIIRNSIVHSNGKLTKKQDIEVAERYGLVNESTIEVTSGRSIKQISVSYEYSKSFIAAIREFFAELYKAMKSGNFL